MKRWIAMLLCALMMLAPAMAESYFGEFAVPPLGDEFSLPTPPADDQAPRGDAASGDTITLSINGEAVTLGFDSSPQYSSIAGGLVQASYYAYGADGVTLYELYLLFPDTVKPGMILTPEYAALAGEECSVVLIISDDDSELYYFASLLGGKIYPENSGFTIGISGVESAGNALTYSGTLQATLVALDIATGEPVATLALAEAPFRFTLETGANSDPGIPNAPATPRPSAMPGDMRKV